MKNHTISKTLLAVGAIAAVLGLASCKSTTTATSTSTYQVTNLVSDTIAEFPGTRSDPNLINAWGMAVDNAGNFYIAANNGGDLVVYDASGNQTHAAINVPSPTGSTGGTPNGVVVNSTTDFGGNIAITSTEDGIIAAWKTGNAATVTVDNSASNTVYKGLAMASSGGKNYLYATDFHHGKIDVFDMNFAHVTLSGSFSDGSIPAGFAPFGIANIGGNIYVTYARQKVSLHDDSAGAGMGYINVFKPDGTSGTRFASQGTLNSPAGLALAPAGFGDFKNDILIPNFGDGTISAYDISGNFVGQMKDQNGALIHIGGLWAIEFGTSGADLNTLHFNAGPNEETHGLVGIIQLK
jgi:uncharacterized protein (TIGR03118 family)